MDFVFQSKIKHLSSSLEPSNSFHPPVNMVDSDDITLKKLKLKVSLLRLIHPPTIYKYLQQTLPQNPLSHSLVKMTQKTKKLILKGNAHSFIKVITLFQPASAHKYFIRKRPQQSKIPMPSFYQYFRSSRPFSKHKLHIKTRRNRSYSIHCRSSSRKSKHQCYPRSRFESRHQ